MSYLMAYIFKVGRFYCMKGKVEQMSPVDILGDPPPPPPSTAGCLHSQLTCHHKQFPCIIVRYNLHGKCRVHCTLFVFFVRKLSLLYRMFRKIPTLLHRSRHRKVIRTKPFLLKYGRFHLYTYVSARYNEHGRLSGNDVI
jgi:hypothetical protein